MFLALCSILCLFAFAWSSNMTHSWEVHHVKGVMKNQVLRIFNITNPENSWHSCYNVTCEGSGCPHSPHNSVEVCYPAIIVTGLPKCGTSAMYDLLSKYSGAITLHEKENCPYVRRRPHWVYFLSLPRMSSVTEGRMIIDGCIDIVANMKIREVLHNPHTTYIVMVRNYADMVWSSYNYWCNWMFDGITCDSTRWVKIGLHSRSPEYFSDIVNGDINGTFVPNPLHDIRRPCSFGGGYYSEYLKFHLWLTVPKNNVVVIASEQLEAQPLRVWQRVVDKMQIPYPLSTLDLGNFTRVRYNTQDHRGPLVSIDKELYQPGLFAVSGFRPMFPETRQQLDKCWVNDCVILSYYSQHVYDACKKEYELMVSENKLTELIAKLES